MLEKFKTRAPFIGSIYRQIYAARFSLALSYLISSCNDLDTSMKMTEDMLDNELIRRKIISCREEISSGKDPFEALQETELFRRYLPECSLLAVVQATWIRLWAKYPRLMSRMYRTDLPD